MLNKMIMAYDAEKFNFASLVGAAIGVKDLAQWHLDCEILGPEEPGFGNQATKLHHSLYTASHEFLPLYKEFVATTVSHIVGESVMYQHLPNWRIQMPGRHGVGNFHRDREGGHNDEEINFWIPLTTVSAENTIWIESREGCEDFAPAVVKYGEMVVFDSTNLLHGNKRNTTDRTRVSFDFRVIPESIFHGQMKEPRHSGIDAPIQWIHS